MFRTLKTILTAGLVLAATAIGAAAATTRYAEIRSTLQPDTTNNGIFLGVGTIQAATFSTATISNKLYLADGTIAAPSLAFNSQKGMGFVRTTTNSMAFVAGSSRTFFTSDIQFDIYSGGVNTWEFGATSFFPQNPLDIGRVTFPVKNFIGQGVQVTTATISTMTVTQAAIGALTINTSLNMNSLKVTNVSSGTVPTDAATYGQLSTWSNVTSSATTTDLTTVSLNFTTSTLGVNLGLKASASGHIAIICTGQVRNNTAGGNVAVALYRDTTNLDDPTGGQGTQSFASNVAGGQLTVIGYDAPGDLTTHAYRVWAKTNGTGTGHFVDGVTGRCIAWETP